MTYCVAWKTSTSAFIITDSAVTNLDMVDDSRELTSFLEKQGELEGRKYVTEGAFKIYSDKRYAIGMVGDVKFGCEVVELISLHLELGRSLDDAIDYTVNNYIDFSSKPCIELVIASFSASPAVMTLKNKERVFKTYHSGLVVLGSPTEKLHSYTRNFFESFYGTWESERLFPNRDEALFMRMLGLLQSYGIHNYTIQNGIGGAYTGVMVDSTGVVHQPDTCFVISGENIAFETKKIASVLVRKNCCCIINTDISDVVISNPLSNDDGELHLEFLGNARRSFDTGRFKYFVFINIKKHVVCIVDIDFKKNHNLMALDVREEKPATLGLMINDTLSRLLNYEDDEEASSDNCYCIYVPYIPASDEAKEYIESNIENIRMGKMFDPVLDMYKYIILEGGETREWYYGNKESIIPFIKHYRDSEHIRIVDIATDFVVLEYKCGDITFPEFDLSFDEITKDIPDKKCEGNIYIFECDVLGDGNPKTINILSSGYVSAHSDAKEIVDNEYEGCHELVFVGLRFYHPDFYWSAKE